MVKSLTPEQLEKRRKAEKARLDAARKYGYSKYSDAMNQNMGFEKNSRSK